MSDFTEEGPVIWRARAGEYLRECESFPLLTAKGPSCSSPVG